jgi:uridine phosphorylase
VDDAIVRPIKGKRSPTLGPVAALVGTSADMTVVVEKLGLTPQHRYPLYISALYAADGQAEKAAVAGPMIGSPYAAMMLETLIAWGAAHFVFFGWCGAVSSRVAVGDIIIPSRAAVDEGTSVHYGLRRAAADGSWAYPSAVIADRLIDQFQRNGLRVHHGAVWSTDAIYRETPDKVRRYQQRDVLAVDMETSALFSVGRFRGVHVAAVLVVSDDLSRFVWKPGFRSAAFRTARHTVSVHVVDVCRALAREHL